MRLGLVAAILTVAAAPVAAQELTYDKDGISFTIPKGDNHVLLTDPEKFNWAKDWQGTLAEWWMGPDIGGRLVHYEYKGTAKDYVEWRLKDWTERFEGSWEVNKRQEGDTWYLECAVKTADATYRYVHVAYVTGSVVYDIMMWAANETFASHRDKVMAVVKSLKVGKGGGGDKPSTGASGVKVARHAWKGCGKGTFVTYKMISEFSGAKTEMTMTMELVETSDDSYTVKTITEMMGTKNEAVQKYVVDPKMEEGGGTGGGEKPQIEKGKDTIEVPAGKFDCEWVQTKTSQATTKTWTSDKVPGGMVKNESKMSAGTSTMVLEKFEKK